MNEKLPIMAKVGTIFLTWRRYLQRDLNPYKITLKQLYVLRQLSRKEFLYPSQIADMLFCDRPTVSVVIKNLERENWIRRERDTENAKQIKLYLTPVGLEKLLSIKSSDESQSFDPLECFTEEEKEQFNLLLNKLGKHMKKIE
jgi:DNA-binding MarR family transcriptional regulator